MIFRSIAGLWPESELERVLEAFAEGKQVCVAGLKGAAKSFYATLLRHHLKMPILLLTSSTELAEQYYRDLRFLDTCFYPEKQKGPRVAYFPDYDTEPYQGISPHPQISIQRMQTLWGLLRGTVDIVVLPIEAAARKLIPPGDFSQAIAEIEWGEERSPFFLAEMLLHFGYKEKDLVTARGDFALRGGILDFYSPGEDLPIRLEFFGNRIESMRAFDSDTQRSLREVEKTIVLALREFILGQKEIQNWGEFSQQRWNGPLYHEELLEKTEQLLEQNSFEGYEEFVSVFYPDAVTLFHYLPGDCCLLLDQPELLKKHYDEWILQYWKRYEQVHQQSRVALEPSEIFHSWDNLFLSDTSRYQLSFADLITDASPQELFLDYQSQSARQYHGHIQEIVNDTLRLFEKGYTCHFVLPTPGKAERLAEILKEYDLPVLFFQNPLEDEKSEREYWKNKILITLGDLNQGFGFPEHQLWLLTEDDLFGESKPQPQPRIRKGTESFVSDLRDLRIEDYVVHVDHGIGQFLGLTTMPMEGQEREFLVLRYAEEDKLYVPVERLDLVQKYVGSGETAPRLDRLGTNVWQKTKSRARASMKEMAEKLLQLYAYRQTVKGYAFPPDDALQREFEDAFEFQETPHQMAAIEDVKEDMESDKPMDRLICGDVGYGKTEVAMRAAFKAVTAGKQVAVLSPTTILAFQHYHTFQKRFEMFPVTIEMVSRFKKPGEIKKILEQLREGKIDIVIGTHRLLSRDVQFHDLGLLIVDEEQRFGVAHKEKLKEMKKNVDALTLTATPIPRTLQMALMGFRPMSVIETPPKDRLAIQTNIVKYNEDTIASAIRAELKRGGQVYLVHNRVETIYSIAALVQRLVPEARVAVAHGQMEERALEKVMLQFIHHEYDVLVATTIIENGIDIPLVNTLIVNRADLFGLSQLYQLRGRVGRSHRRAYSYFLIPSEKELTPVARRRLAALREFTELGSGFRLAALDLEIRGAGNLLGSEQHGHIAALGFELYCRMLEQTVKELQGEEAPADFSTSVNLDIDIRIPDSYIPNINQRLNLYKRIATIHSEESLAALREEIIDRFGPIPDSVSNLLEYGRIKSRAEKLRIRSIDRSNGSLFFQLTQEGPIKAENILRFIQKFKGTALSPAGVLRFPAEKLHPPEKLFQTVNTVLEELAGEIITAQPLHE